MTITNKQWQDDVALHRYQMIAPLLSEDLDNAKRVALRKKIAANLLDLQVASDIIEEEIVLFRHHFEVQRSVRRKFHKEFAADILRKEHAGHMKFLLDLLRKNRKLLVEEIFLCIGRRAAENYVLAVFVVTDILHLCHD